MPAYYRSPVATFLADDPNRIIGILASESAKTGFTDLKQRQTKAWEKEIEVPRFTLNTLARDLPTSGNWGLLLEYPIPRRQRRVDTILLAADLIFCLEFKTENRSHSQQTQNQAEDYALDLRDFHEEIRSRRIIPIAVTVNAEQSHCVSAKVIND